jgi:membrane-associated phospholipid phosphatase/MFS family permease
VNAVSGTRAPSRSRLAARRACPGAPGAPAPDRARLGRPALLVVFSLAAVGAGTARALTTTYLPVLLERIEDAPSLIGAVMTVNAISGLVVPVAVGAWSDRREASGLGRRLPFMIGGTAIASGGLVAVALGNESSYIALGLAAAVVYTGLNALTTLHRALVADDVADERRPAATSAQEFAATVGAGIAVGIGAALIEPAPALAFVLAAGVLAMSTVPTLIITRRLGLGSARPAPRGGWRASLRGALRRPGPREVLLAQALWVFAYAALPAFFVLYAKEELDLDVGIAGALPLAFGGFVAVGMVMAGRVDRERVHGMLLWGAALLGAGLVIAGLTGRFALVGVALAAAALGAGLLTALGFPYFARFVPDGEAGSYSGAFFAGRGLAAAAALPLAGLGVELTGSYRSVLWLGAAALLALAPLAVAERIRVAATAPARPRPITVAAVIPVFASARAAEVARATLRHVDEVVLVDDGAPPEVARSLHPLAADERVRLLALGHNGGKGTAVAAGLELVLESASQPDAIVVLDSDGQHDPERIPAMVDAARTADAVIGWRRDRRGMPPHRRLANRAASLTLFAATRRWLPDTQNGMRLFRTEALRAVPMPGGGYEAESRHLRALIAADRRVASVEIPTIYEGEPSHFRPLADTLAVARGLLAASPPEDSPRGFHALREWVPRLAAALAAVLAIGAALPALQPLDNQLFLAINRLGDGPEWLYQALDPHARNYALLVLTAAVAAAVVLRRPRYVLGTAIAVVLAGYLAGAALEVVKLFIERARPEEVLGAQVQLSHGRSWSHIASFPSGHLIVTTAMAAAAASAVRALRVPLLVYVAAVAFTRVLFGAHFPLDVLVGVALGYELGLFTARLLANARLLPEPMPVWSRRRALDEPAGAHLRPHKA